MRLATFTIGGRPSFGLLSERGVVDLGARTPYGSLVEYLARADLASAQRIAEFPSDYGVEEVALGLPLPGAEKIVCVGINYPERGAEYDREVKSGRYPNLFVRFPSSFAPHESAIVRPTLSEQLDYEGEVAVVIGKRGRHIAVPDALDHVAGLTLANDGTVRDWVRHGTLNVTQGKNFDRSGSIGPYVVTTDELDPSQPLTLTTRVNGELRQSDSTAHMSWGFAALVSYVSAFSTLLPGDVILTGTPVGAGAHSTPPRYLVPGDIVEVAVDGIGVLRNYVVDEATAGAQ